MKVHYPKLYNMAHLSLNVFTASKESNNFILFTKNVVSSLGLYYCIELSCILHSVLTQHGKAPIQ